MPAAAHITSTAAIPALKLALQQFAESVAKALVELDLQTRRSSDWIDERCRYWPRELHTASDAMNEARLALERCELTVDTADRRPCYDERKALERAKRRVRMVEQKIDAARRWRNVLRKEVEEFQVQIAKMNEYLDGDLIRAVATLQRLGEALDRYVESSAPRQAGVASDPLPQGPL